MKTLKSDPQAIFFSTMLYHLLLITYPKEFQREYARSMAQVFRDCCLQAFHTRGLPGMISLWSLALVDYIKSVFQEYTRKGVHISASRFIRLSGWSLIMGIITFFTDLLVEVQTSGHGLPSNPYNFFSRPIDQFFAVLPYILIPSAMVLLTIGLIGLYIKYGSRAGLLVKLGLVTAILGCGFTLIIYILPHGSYGFALFVVENHIGGWWPNDLAALGLFLLFGGVFIFGIDAVKRQLLPRWNFIPILAGIMFPVRILLGYLQEATTVGWSRWRVDITMINLPMLIITSFGLLALGYLLMSDAPQEEQLAMGNPGAMD